MSSAPPLLWNLKLSYIFIRLNLVCNLYEFTRPFLKFVLNLLSPCYFSIQDALSSNHIVRLRENNLVNINVSYKNHFRKIIDPFIKIEHRVLYSYMYDYNYNQVE